MDRAEFDAVTAADAHARAEHERDELRQSLWLQVAHEIQLCGGKTAGDLPVDRADHFFDAAGAVYDDTSHARRDDH
jgi:hypothetical protein